MFQQCYMEIMQAIVKDDGLYIDHIEMLGFFSDIRVVKIDGLLYFNYYLFVHLKMDAQEKWNRSRIIMRIYLIVLVAVLAGFYVYAHAIPYTQTYNANCNAPGVLQTQIWDWNFVIQAFYAICFLPLLAIGYEMLVSWYSRVPYVCFVIWCLLVTAWMTATAIFLSWQAANANTCESVGNPASDLRICGACGQFPSWNSICFNTAPYNPPIENGLSMNLPRAFQLGFHWALWALSVFALIYVPTEYLKAQNGYIPYVLKNQEEEPQDEEEVEEKPEEPVKFRIQARIPHHRMSLLK